MSSTIAMPNVIGIFLPELTAAGLAATVIGRNDGYVWVQIVMFLLVIVNLCLFRES